MCLVTQPTRAVSRKVARSSKSPTEAASAGVSPVQPLAEQPPHDVNAVAPEAAVDTTHASAAGKKQAAAPKRQRRRNRKQYPDSDDRCDD